MRLWVDTIVRRIQITISTLFGNDLTGQALNRFKLDLHIITISMPVPVLPRSVAIQERGLSALKRMIKSSPAFTNVVGHTPQTAAGLA